MTTAATLTIGDELLIGQVADTNSAALSRALGALGIRVVRMCTVGDEAADITDALAALLAQVDVVVATGGLGPTKDDKTKGVLARFFGAEKMALHEPTLRHVEALAAARGMAMNELNVAQAYVPEGCTALPNALGTAPGLWFERGAKVVVALPGVPFEAEHLMAQEVAPRLRERFATPSIVHRTALVFGVAESALAERIAGWEGALPPHLHLAYLPTPLGVKLRLSTYGAADADAAEQDMLRRFEALRQLAPEHFVGVGEGTLETFVAQRLREQGRTVATAESCTGGAVAALLTSVSGSSAYFRGGVVAYSAEAKAAVLGVSATDIAAHGAVSEAVACQLAQGARRLLRADFAVATTGVAGPTGGTPQAPVGTVWVAVATPDGAATARLLRLGADTRPNIVARAAARALDMLREVLG